MKGESINKSQRVVVSALLLVLAIAFVTIFSFSTSPLFNNFEYADSSVYKIIGRGWVDGKVPYVDLWDQKGPLIYFINAAGYWIAGSDKGVWLVQCVFAFVSLLLSYRFFKTSMSTLMSMVSVFFVTLALIQTYCCGNNVEEYNMPFLMASLFGAYTWADKVQTTGEVDHSPRLAAIYGITFAVSAAMRLTNAMGVAFAMLVITVMLVRHGRWKNLLYNAIWFVCAFVAGLLPFIVYFAVKNALPDLWFGAIGFNLDYVQASRIPETLIEWYRHIRYSLNGYMAIIFGIVLVLFTNRKFIGAMFVLSPLPILLWIFYGLGYEHYSMLLLPYLCWLIREGYLLYTRLSTNLSRRVLLLVCSMLVVFDCVYAARIAAGVPRKFSQDNKEMVAYGELIKSIPNWVKEDIMLYNPCPGAYIVYGVIPRHKFFFGCDYLANKSPTYTRMILEEYNLKSPQWVIYQANGAGIFPEYIKPILDEKYSLVSQRGELTLYHLNSD